MLYVLSWYALASLITIVVYWWDKRRARKEAWRVKERTLHILELLGGWPGGLVAQRWFHHKWKKSGYMRVFWSIVALHVLVWAVCVYFEIR